MEKNQSQFRGAWHKHSLIFICWTKNKKKKDIVKHNSVAKTPFPNANQDKQWMKDFGSNFLRVNLEVRDVARQGMLVHFICCEALRTSSQP